MPYILKYEYMAEMNDIMSGNRQHYLDKQIKNCFPE